MNKPKKVEVIAIRTTPAKTTSQLIPVKSTINEAKRTGTNALIIPKSIAPVVLESMSRFRLMGASNNLSKERLFLSKVMVTASIEVVPKRIDNAITPGNMLRISTSLFDLIKNIRVQEMGKMIPQLILGGFR